MGIRELESLEGSLSSTCKDTDFRIHATVRKRDISPAEIDVSWNKAYPWIWNSHQASGCFENTVLRINKVAKAFSSSRKHGLSGRLQEDERGWTTTLHRIFLHLSSKALMYSVMDNYRRRL